jgi:hypothetical protein
MQAFTVDRGLACPTACVPARPKVASCLAIVATGMMNQESVSKVHQIPQDAPYWSGILNHLATPDSISWYMRCQRSV